MIHFLQPSVIWYISRDVYKQQLEHAVHIKPSMMRSAIQKHFSLEMKVSGRVGLLVESHSNQRDEPGGVRGVCWVL